MAELNDQLGVNDDMEKRTAQLILCRDKIKEIYDKADAAAKEWKDAEKLVLGRIQTFLNAHSLENLKTKAGTCYLTRRTTASLADPEAFMQYVTENKAFDLMDRRANTTAVKDFVKKHKTLPPGCNLSTIEQVGVRRASGTGGETTE